MDCYCASKTLYSPENEARIYPLQSQTSHNRKYVPAQREPLKPLSNPLESQFLSIFEKSFEVSSISFSPQIPKVEFLDILENPLFFFREFVSKNFPCIIQNALDSWEAMENWKDYGYLTEKLGGKKITVDLTPDGFADSIKNKYFVEPYQSQSTMKEFINLNENEATESFVGYIQKQNDNLTDEFGVFFEEDVDLSLKEFFANKVFGKKADACNFWMGKNPSVSSLHKDHYENIYAVVSGEKHFTLIPPVCYPFLCESEFLRSRWSLDPEKNELFIQEPPEKSPTNWLSVNPDSPSDRKKFKALENEDLCRIYHCSVEAGEVLYLPSIWFHQVSQYSKIKEGYTMAVNFWFDMEFGNNFALMETLKSLT